VPAHRVEDRGAILWPCHAAIDLSERRVVVITDAGRARAMQIELVEETRCSRPLASDEFVTQVAPHSPVHLEIAVRIAPAEI